MTLGSGTTTTGESLPVVTCSGASRTFGVGNAEVSALKPTSCEVLSGEQIALTGPSGSGKSTLLHLMAGLDDPSRGAIEWPSIGGRESLRPHNVAMVFQGPSLLPALTVEENVALPLILDGRSDSESRIRARSVLAQFNLDEIAEKLPDELSGGQSQRVAVARALAGNPKLILADEPTGQLDGANAAMVVEALMIAARESGSALIVTTHDENMAALLPRRWKMQDGNLLEASSKGR